MPQEHSYSFWRTHQGLLHGLILPCILLLILLYDLAHDSRLSSDPNALIAIGIISLLSVAMGVAIRQVNRSRIGTLVVTDEGLEFVDLRGQRTRILWSDKPLYTKIHPNSPLGEAGMHQRGLAVAVPERQISIYASISDFEALERLISSRCQPVPGAPS
jgi:hypothetical protein